MPLLFGLSLGFLALSSIELFTAWFVPQEKKLIWEIRSIGSAVAAQIFWCTWLILQAVNRRGRP